MLHAVLFHDFRCRKFNLYANHWFGRACSLAHNGHMHEYYRASALSKYWRNRYNDAVQARKNYARRVAALEQYRLQVKCRSCGVVPDPIFMDGDVVFCETCYEHLFIVDDDFDFDIDDLPF